MGRLLGLPDDCPLAIFTALDDPGLLPETQGNSLGASS